jgi:hypothetical protein
MALFDIDSPKASRGYKTLKSAASDSTAGQIRDALEAMWIDYEPYADTDFRDAFAIDEDPGFWEMYLTLVMLGGRKKLRKRAELTLAQRNTGPDICIKKGNRHIWIEAMAPDRGDEKANPDQVPESKSGLNNAKDNPRRQIELRITHALRTKAKKFAGYREQGIIGEKDSCIVAVSAGQFSLQAAGEFLPHVISAVYPIGEEITTLDPKTGRIRTRYAYSAEIERTKGTKPENPVRENIIRTAFHSDDHKSISGLVWSLRSIGNFKGQPHDLLYLHNQAAERPIPRRWFNWADQYFSNDNGTELIRKQRRAQKIRKAI